MNAERFRPSTLPTVSVGVQVDPGSAFDRRAIPDVVAVPVRAPGGQGAAVSVGDAGDAGDLSVTAGARWIARSTGVELPETLGAAWSARTGFTGAVGQRAVVVAGSGPEVVVVGVGPDEVPSAEQWRRSAAAAMAASGRAGRVAFVVPDELLGDGSTPEAGRAASAITEGALLAAYRFAGYHAGTADGPSGSPAALGSSGAPRGHLSLLTSVASLDEARAGAERGVVIAGATASARDLVNTPPSRCTPARMAEVVADWLEGLPGVHLEVWDRERLVAEGMGGILGVSRGSTEPPCLLRATYEPETGGAGRDIGHVVLVGKGITFDSGGLSLKTPDGMTTMKTDMSGAAAVMAALAACPRLGVPVRVTALAPLAENMPSGSAIKPGDVLRIRNGATVEVLNTDAEGRLVLADALSLAAEMAPDAIVDLATLTGAAVVALGRSIAAVFGTEEELLARVRTAGAQAGEPSWPLPLPEEYADHIDSDVADMKNIGRPGQAGSIAAALLLRRFVGSTPWAHLDIAGPARAADASGYLTKGGTGFGVRTLLELLCGYRGGPAAPGTD